MALPRILSEIEQDRVDDQFLIDCTRKGDESAFERLYVKHRVASLRYASNLAGASGADDLVAEAFMRVLIVLRRGGGPTQKFRAYLLSTVRNTYVDQVWRASRTPTAGARMSTVTFQCALENELLDVYSELSVRWQLVLWLRDVEELALEDAAALLELTPNATAALHFRARRGLRSAYLTR